MLPPPCRSLKTSDTNAYGAFGVAEALAELRQVLRKHSHDPLGIDGYLFEVHVWATYNFDAVEKGLPYRWAGMGERGTRPRGGGGQPGAYLFVGGNGMCWA